MVICYVSSPLASQSPCQWNNISMTVTTADQPFPLLRPSVSFYPSGIVVAVTLGRGTTSAPWPLGRDTSSNLLAYVPHMVDSSTEVSSPLLKTQILSMLLSWTSCSVSITVPPRTLLRDGRRSPMSSSGFPQPYATTCKGLVISLYPPKAA